MRYIIRLLRVFWRNKPKETVRRDMRKKWYEAYDPAGHARSVACARRSVWGVGGQQRLFVHVLAGRRRLSREARGKQREVTKDREARSLAGFARFRRRFASGLVPANAARCTPVA